MKFSKYYDVVSVLFVMTVEVKFSSAVVWLSETLPICLLPLLLSMRHRDALPVLFLIVFRLSLL